MFTFRISLAFIFVYPSYLPYVYNTNIIPTHSSPHSARCQPHSQSSHPSSLIALYSSNEKFIINSSWDFKDLVTNLRNGLQPTLTISRDQQTITVLSSIRLGKSKSCSDLKWMVYVPMKASASNEIDDLTSSLHSVPLEPKSLDCTVRISK